MRGESNCQIDTSRSVLAVPALVSALRLDLQRRPELNAGISKKPAGDRGRIGDVQLGKSTVLRKPLPLIALYFHALGIYFLRRYRDLNPELSQPPHQFLNRLLRIQLIVVIHS